MAVTGTKPKDFDVKAKADIDLSNMHLITIHGAGATPALQNMITTYQDVTDLAISDGAVDTTNFDGNLSASDDTVQKALETIDDLSVSSSQTYSTTEASIGTWLGDTLYRKVIDFGSLPNSTSKNVAHNITNLNVVTRYDFVAYNQTSYYVAPNVAFGSTEANISDTNVFLLTTSDRSGDTAKVIIEYTKTA